MSAFTTADVNAIGSAGQASAFHEDKKTPGGGLDQRVDEEKTPGGLDQHVEDAESLKITRQFVRTYSGASTECFEGTLALDGFDGHRCFSDGDGSLSPSSRCHFDEPTIDRVDEHMMRVKSQNDRMEASEIGICFRDEDGMVWVRTFGQGVEKQREAYNQRLDALSQSLEEAKELLRNTSGEDADDSSDESGIDEDGMVWMRTDGQGAAEQSDIYQGKVAAVQDLCDEVKLLWRAKFGEDPDDSDSDNGAYIDGDNTAWVKTGSEDAEMQKWAYRERLAALDESLDEAKRAYFDKFGERVEEGDAEDYVHDADGTAWLRTTGDGAESQREGYFERLECLQTSLAEVKDLFHDVTGQDVEEEDDFLDDDGTAWLRTDGDSAESQRERYFERLDRLEASLAEVKDLFHEVTGHDVEEEDFVDDDGTLWVRSTGEGIDKQQELYDSRIDSLTDLLDDAKALYGATTGEDLDQPDLIDEDGLLWTRIEAVPAAEEKSAYDNRIDLLLEQCSQTKAMLKAQSGEDFDQEDFVDDEGTLWIREVGAGFPKQRQAYQQRLGNLESSLKELQAQC